MQTETCSTKVEIFNNFDEMNLDELLLRGIYAYGFEKPSYIQQNAIVPLSKGKDVIAQAQSGTGKTATFLIGTIQKILVKLKTQKEQKEQKEQKDQKSKVSAVVIAPTRELAQQIFTVCNQLTRYTPITSHCAIGGINIYEDIRSINKGVDIIIGTPGRILHL